MQHEIATFCSSFNQSLPSSAMRLQSCPMIGWNMSRKYNFCHKAVWSCCPMKVNAKSFEQFSCICYILGFIVLIWKIFKDFNISLYEFKKQKFPMGCHELFTYARTKHADGWQYNICIYIYLWCHTQRFVDGYVWQLCILYTQMWHIFCILAKIDSGM